MLLEDFAGELDRPIKSLDILEETLELMIEEEIQANEASRRVLAVLFAIKQVIESLTDLHEKYNNIIEKEYEKMRADKAIFKI